jgi:hypothetical protein
MTCIARADFFFGGGAWIAAFGKYHDFDDV